MKKLFLILMTIALLMGCDEDFDISQSGNLVPLTVNQDPTLASISVNGTLLHSEAFGDANDPMLIFLHGGPGGDYRNAYNLNDLVNEGFYVVFYDQRGSGLSQRHPQDSYSIQLMLDDLTAVIEHYRQSVSQEIFLFGHSWGAMLSAAYINEYPDRIAGAILAEPGGLTKSLLDEYGETSRELAVFSEATNDVLYYDQFLTGKEDEHAILDYKFSIATSFSYAEGNNEGIEGPSPFWRNGAAVLQSMIDIAEEDGFDFTTNLNQYDTQVLFIYGSLNQSYGLDFAQKEARFFPNALIEEIEGTGHEMIYFRWDNVRPVVVNYLNSLR